MKSIFIKSSILILVFLLPPVFCLADNPFPSFPMAFWGNATLNDEPLSAGTIIRAYCNDNLIGETTMVEDEIYGYAETTKNKLLVSSCDDDILFKYLPQGAGEDLTGGIEVKYTEGFVSGITINKDLNFITTRACDIPNGAGIQTWDGNSWGDCTVSSCNSGYHQEDNSCVADSSGGGGYSPPPVPEIITTKEDMNEDGVTDFDDFAIFALLYEKTYTNSNDKVENIPISWGDFNSDGSVDFDDFAVFALSYGK